MKRLLPLLIVLFAFLIGIFALSGAAFGQTGSDELLRSYRVIGRERPTGILYDPNFDRFAWTTPDGELVLVDARTYQPIRSLYETFDYARHYAFSHDGRWIAVANGRIVDLISTETGEIVASIEPNGSRGIESPLIFSDDDTYLLMSVVVPERPELRRSENDTTITPWLWDLPNARDEARSSLPNRVDALPFFDNRNGFILGPGNIILAALPRRMQIFDADIDLFTPLGEIQTERFEQDPVDVWFSEFDDLIYHRPVNSRTMYQVDGRTGTVTPIPLGTALSAVGMRELDSIRFGSSASVIGEPSSRTGNSLLRALLGTEYQRSYGDHPLTVMLIDQLNPITVSSDQTGLLIYILDETTGRGTFDVIQPGEAIRYAINEDRTKIAIRESSGLQAVTIYDLATGVHLNQFIPSLPDNGRRDLVQWVGDELIVGMERFNAVTGAVIAAELEYSEFIDFTFSTDNGTLITWVPRADGSAEWWRWDLETEQVIQRGTPSTYGTAISTIGTLGERGLFSIQYMQPDGSILRGVEIVDALADTREAFFFEEFMDRTIELVQPSPDWQHFLVVYGEDYRNREPGVEVVIYRFGEGMIWHYAGSDLPYRSSRDYGWIDSDTAYIAGQDFGDELPDRVYGLEFDPSGVPACLVESFPDDWTRWRDLWEHLTLTISSNRLMLLARELCNALPTDVSGVEAVFFPTATPTRPYASPTPAVIAGVPECLTRRYSREAIGYAQSWREMTAGLTPEEITQLEVLLCEGLGSGDAPPSDAAGTDPLTQVYLIDVNTGERETGSYVPSVPRTLADNVNVIADYYRLIEGRVLYEPVLSPNRQMLASFDGSNSFINVYQVITPYETIAAYATATAEPRTADDPRRIGVRPTATQPFDSIGGARPTTTPTITPTSPPLAEIVLDLADRTRRTEICTASVNTTENPPPGYAPPGEILVTLNDSPYIWRLNPQTGDLRPDETIPPCGFGVPCEYSRDNQWALLVSDFVAVFHPDGSDPQVLFSGGEVSQLYGFTWRDERTVEYRYEGYLPDRRDPVSLIQTYDVESGEYSEPFEPRGGLQLNQLPVDIVGEQPESGEIVLGRQSFNTLGGTGYKYYLINRTTGTVDYFARLSDPSNNYISHEWHPSGDTLYYYLPGINDVFVYNVAERTHSRMDFLPDGIWSPDGRYRAAWAHDLTSDELEDRLDADESIPVLRIWDRETGEFRYLCIPGIEGTNYPSTTPVWSPDGRYMFMRFVVPDEGGRLETARARTFILDTETDSLTEIVGTRALDIDHFIVWWMP